MPFFRWDEMSRQNLGKPSDAEGSIIIGDYVTLNRSVAAPGKLARPHSHGCEQMINVVEGAAWFRVDDEERNVGPGDVIHIPKGAVHEFRNTGDGAFVYLSFKNKSDDWPPAHVRETT